MKWYKRLYYYLLDGNLPKHGAAPTSRSRIVNDPITWGDLCDKQPTWKVDPPKPWPDPPDPPPKRFLNEDVIITKPSINADELIKLKDAIRKEYNKKPYYKVDFINEKGREHDAYYQPADTELKLDKWYCMYRVSLEYMTEEEFNNLPDYEGEWV